MSEIDRLDDFAKTVQRPIKTDFDDLDASVAGCSLWLTWAFWEGLDGQGKPLISTPSPHHLVFNPATILLL